MNDLKSSSILLLNGPNLNLLGEREPVIYGTNTLVELEKSLSIRAKSLGYRLITKQSNSEGRLIDLIQSFRHGTDQSVAGMIINPAAYTHTSVAIRDALIASKIPSIEVHISQLAKRESFRQKSLISDVVLGTVSGFGLYGYELALLALVNHLEDV